MPKEQWRPVVGFEKSHEISNLGRVRGLARRVVRYDGFKKRVAPKILKTWIAKTGYPTVALCRGNKTICKCVHRLLAEAFIPRNNSALNQIDHINRNRSDNRLRNLRWADNALNTYNQRQRPKGNNPARGIYFKARCTQNPWIAVIKQTYLGAFSTKREAMAARRRALAKAIAEYKT